VTAADMSRAASEVYRNISSHSRLWRLKRWAFCSPAIKINRQVLRPAIGMAADNACTENADLRDRGINCYGFSSSLRNIGGGFSQFRPVFMPVIWTQILPGNSALSGLFNGKAVLDRDTTHFPIPDCSHRHAKQISKNFPSIDQSSRCIEGLRRRRIRGVSDFHASI